MATVSQRAGRLRACTTVAGCISLRGRPSYPLSHLLLPVVLASPGRGARAMPAEHHQYDLDGSMASETCAGTSGPGAGGSREITRPRRRSRKRLTPREDCLHSGGCMAVAIRTSSPPGRRAQGNSQWTYRKASKQIHAADVPNAAPWRRRRRGGCAAGGWFLRRWACFSGHRLRPWRAPC